MDAWGTSISRGRPVSAHPWEPGSFPPWTLGRPTLVCVLRDPRVPQSPGVWGVTTLGSRGRGPGLLLAPGHVDLERRGAGELKASYDSPVYFSVVLAALQSSGLPFGAFHRFPRASSPTPAPVITPHSQRAPPGLPPHLLPCRATSRLILLREPFQLAGGPSASLAGCSCLPSLASAALGIQPRWTTLCCWNAVTGHMSASGLAASASPSLVPLSSCVPKSGAIPRVIS